MAPSSVRSWDGLEGKTGLKLKDLSERLKASTLHSSLCHGQAGHWLLQRRNGAAIEENGRTPYTPFQINVQRLCAFQDAYRPSAFFMLTMPGCAAWAKPCLFTGPACPGRNWRGERHTEQARNDLVLNFLSVHSKWSIHSSYSDVHIMRASLSRKRQRNLAE